MLASKNAQIKELRQKLKENGGDQEEEEEWIHEQYDDWLMNIGEWMDIESAAVHFIKTS